MKTFIVLLLLAFSSACYAASDNISWQAPSILPDNSNAPTGYNVYVNGTKVGSTGAATLTFSYPITEAPGTNLCATVTAFNTAGESAQSQPPSCVVVPFAIPGVPTNVQSVIVP